MLGTIRRLSIVLIAGAGLAACASGGDLAPPPSSGEYKVGQPYEINGTWYYPKEQPDYDEEGIASWYGPTFYGHRTANGEIFDASAMTAAHRTLPLPVNVRVTNLDNGRTAILRVNDRGPYAHDRIIDVSEHAAEVLGFKNAGTAHVRVQYIGRADAGSAPPDDNTALASNNATAHSTDGDDDDAADASSSGPVSDAAEVAQTAALNAAGMGAAAVAAAPAVVPPPPAAVVAAAPLPAPPVMSSGDSTQDASEDDSGADPETAVAPPPVAVAAADPPPAQAVNPAPAPAAAPGEPAAHARLYVQAGAFSSRANADRLVSLLASIGNFFVSPIEKAGAELYRVRTGPFDDLGDATAALARVTGLGNSSARIIVDQ